MAERKPLIVANWKMNKTADEADILAKDLLGQLDVTIVGQLDLVLCPTFLSITTVASALKCDGSEAGVEALPEILLGAQDVYHAPDGAFTGAINARMLAAAGVSYCIVGHSERRQNFGETDQTIAPKLVALIQAGIVPILCVGESYLNRRAGASDAQAYVLSQVCVALEDALAQGLQPSEATLAIAYEPIWSIGTGQSATPEQAQEIATAIRGELSFVLDKELAQSTRVLYGGSVNSGNVAEFAMMPDLDGCLVGGASLDATEFSQLVTNYTAARS
ncbi:MAG: triose-phosphate isomerase [Coriobacteriia bacterium]|nr:triose-phosphate isomerase [Coriobacteriia bacterium]